MIHAKSINKQEKAKPKAAAAVNSIAPKNNSVEPIIKHEEEDPLVAFTFGE